MARHRRVQQTRRRRRGATIVEFALVLLPFTLVLMGGVHLGYGMIARNHLSNAASKAARVCSVQPNNRANCARQVVEDAMTEIGQRCPVNVAVDQRRLDQVDVFSVTATCRYQVWVSSGLRQEMANQGIIQLRAEASMPIVL